MSNMIGMPEVQRSASFNKLAVGFRFRDKSYTHLGYVRFNWEAEDLIREGRAKGKHRKAIKGRDPKLGTPDDCYDDMTRNENPHHL